MALNMKAFGKLTADGNTGVLVNKSYSGWGYVKRITGTLVVSGALGGGTYKVQARIAGDWYDVPNATGNAVGLKDVQCDAEALRVNLASSTTPTAHFGFLTELSFGAEES